MFWMVLAALSSNTYGDLINADIETSFVEECDTWDTNIWGYYWNPPDVVNGTWVFDFPTGVVREAQANHLEMTGYGTYEVKFRTSGSRVPDVDFWIFLYNDSIPEPNHQELDMAEIFGGNPLPREWSVSMWRDGNQSYWFFQAPIDFEDSEFHVFECIYSAEKVELLIDDIFMYIINENPEPPFAIPYPPMQFMIGGCSHEIPVADFQFVIDRIEYINDDTTSIENPHSGIDPEYMLHQNSPNPFNSFTAIEYSVARPCNVRISIFNQLGQEVNVLVNEYILTGEYSINWDGKDAEDNILSNGIYFYRIAAGNQVYTNKMLYLR